jgi:hypothetical protein
MTVHQQGASKAHGATIHSQHPSTARAMATTQR